MNVKWLRRLKVTDGPTHTKDETSKYTDLLPDGKALQFTFEMGVKSVITRPVVDGMTLPGAGLYEISGLAWSGAGRIRAGRGVDRRRRDLDAGDACSVASAAEVPSCASGCRGSGTASRPCCRAAPPTRRGACSRARERASRARGDNRFHYNAIVSLGGRRRREVKHVYA